MIQVHCDRCRAAYCVPETFAGRQARCKQCGNPFTVPAASEAPARSIRPAAGVEGQDRDAAGASADASPSKQAPINWSLLLGEVARDQAAGAPKPSPKPMDGPIDPELPASPGSTSASGARGGPRRRQPGSVAASPMAVGVLDPGEALRPRRPERYGQTWLIGPLLLVALISLVVDFAFSVKTHGFKASLIGVMVVLGAGLLFMAPAGCLGTFLTSRMMRFRTSFLFSGTLAWMSVPALAMLCARLIAPMTDGAVAGVVFISMGLVLPYPVFKWVFGLRPVESLVGFVTNLVLCIPAAFLGFTIFSGIAFYLWIGPEQERLALERRQEIAREFDEAQRAFTERLEADQRERQRVFEQQQEERERRLAEYLGSLRPSVPGASQLKPLPLVPTDLGPASLADVPTPAFPALGSGKPFGEGVNLHELHLSGLHASHDMRLWVYLPTGDGRGQPRPCVLVPAGIASPLAGGPLTEADRTLHGLLARRGLVVVAFDVAGSTEAAGVELSLTFHATEGGAMNAHHAMQLARRLEQVDAQRIHILGCGANAGVAVRFAAASDALAGCILIQPVVDLREHVGDDRLRQMEDIQAGAVQGLDRLSPVNLASHLRAPVLLASLAYAQASSRARLQRFAAAMRHARRPLTEVPGRYQEHRLATTLFAVATATRWIHSRHTQAEPDPSHHPVLTAALGTQLERATALRDLAATSPDPALHDLAILVFEDAFADGAVELRLGGLLGLGRWNPDQLLRYVAQGLRDSDASLRETALDLLGAQRPEELVEPLLDVLVSTPRAAEVLGGYGHDLEPALLLRLASRSSAGELVAMLELLPRVGTLESLATVRRLTEHDSESVGQAAMLAWLAIEPASFDVAAHCLADFTSASPGRHARGLALLASSQPEADRHAEVSAALLASLRTHPPMNEITALAACEAWRHPSMVEAMLGWMEQDTPVHQRRLAMQALGRWQVREAVFPVARWLLLDRQFAKDCLIGFGEVAEEEVIRLLRHNNPEVALDACEILSAVGTRRSAQALTNLGRSNNRELAEAARAALRQVYDRLRQTPGG